MSERLSEAARNWLGYIPDAWGAPPRYLPEPTLAGLIRRGLVETHAGQVRKTSAGVTAFNRSK